MLTRRRAAVMTFMILIGVAIAACRDSGERARQTTAAATAIAPATMKRVGSVDERYQSYNVEMLEVTGGKFWKPYGPELHAILKEPSPTEVFNGADTPAGMN